MGMLVGVEAGIVGGLVSVDSIEKFSDNDVDKLPNLGIYARVDAPFGFGAEVTLLPLEVDDIKFNSFSFAGRMNVNKFIPILPISAKLKVRLGNADIDYKGVEGGNAIEGNMSNKFTSIDLTLGKKFLIIEPYVGIGYIDAKGDFNFTSSGVANSDKDIGMSTDHIFAGVNLNLIGMRFGVEYASLYGTDRVLAKLGFGFGL